jgi:hypothetical protein
MRLERLDLLAGSVGWRAIGQAQRQSGDLVLIRGCDELFTINLCK